MFRDSKAVIESATLNGSGRPGVSSGDALKEMERVQKAKERDENELVHGKPSRILGT